jgi:hypothetical protein
MIDGIFGQNSRPVMDFGGPCHWFADPAGEDTGGGSGEAAVETTQATTAETPASDNGEWKSNLPDDMKGSASLTDINTVEDLAKSFISAQSLLGKSRIGVLSSDASPEEEAEFYNKIGRPKSVDGYELPTEGIPEDVSVDKGRLDSILKLAHETGMTKKQVAKMYRGMLELDSSNAQNMEKERATYQDNAVNTLKKEWGHAFDEKTSLASNTAKKFGGESFINMLEETGMGNNIDLIRAFANIGRIVAEDEIHGKGSSESFVMSPAEAKVEITTKMNDREFMSAYKSRANSGNMEAVKRMQQLHSLAYPEEDGT